MSYFLPGVSFFVSFFVSVFLSFLQRQTDEAGDGVGRVEIDHVKEDERRIGLKAAGGEAFSITYQTDYPTSAEEYLVSRPYVVPGVFVL